MAKIKLGYNDQPLYLMFSKRDGGRMANVEVEQVDKDSAPAKNTNFLAHATLYELLDLRDEINDAIKEITT